MPADTEQGTNIGRKIYILNWEWGIILCFCVLNICFALNLVIIKSNFNFKFSALLKIKIFIVIDESKLKWFSRLLKCSPHYKNKHICF